MTVKQYRDNGLSWRLLNGSLKRKELVPGWLCGGVGEKERNQSNAQVPGKGPEISPKGLYLEILTTFVFISSGLNLK